MSVVAVFAGVIVVLAVSGSIAKALVIPRGSLPRLARMVDYIVDFLFRLAIRPLKSYKSVDTLRTSQAAVVIFGSLALWVALFLLGFALMLTPAVHSFGASLREAGASLLTLGFVATDTPWATFVDFLAGFVGLAVVALQISYLPTLYGAYNRRESEVALLGARAGDPAWGPEILARTRLGFVDLELPHLYQLWEKWSAEVAETHSNYPILILFRSPGAYVSWLVSLLAILDSAALYLSFSPNEAPVEARICLRMGFIAFRKIGLSVGYKVNEDPLPTDPVHLTYEEFLEGHARLLEVGFPLERTPEEAWPHFRGWRVNYEETAYQLNSRTDAVPAHWSGPRRSTYEFQPKSRVRDRTPEAPQG